MSYSIHSTLRELLANDRAKAILETYIPGSTSHPDLPMALHMTLREISYYPEAAQAGLTPERLETIDAELKKILP